MYLRAHPSGLRESSTSGWLLRAWLFTGSGPVVELEPGPVVIHQQFHRPVYNRQPWCLMVAVPVTVRTVIKHTRHLPGCVLVPRSCGASSCSDKVGYARFPVHACARWCRRDFNARQRGHCWQPIGRHERCRRYDTCRDDVIAERTSASNSRGPRERERTVTGCVLRLPPWGKGSIPIRVLERILSAGEGQSCHQPAGVVPSHLAIIGTRVPPSYRDL